MINVCYRCCYYFFSDYMGGELGENKFRSININLGISEKVRRRVRRV